MGSSDKPEDLDAAFDEIVAEWRQEGSAPVWPEQQVDEVPVDSGTTTLPLELPAKRDREEDEHFVPPEPPPLPPLRGPTIGALLLMAIGVLLLVAPEVIGLNSQTGLILALLALASGVGLLILKMKQDPPEGWDDGAQV
ncbi:hypothetical protein D5S17_31010 [Pseudonocardiaceae bacterium YIM PH 21723]|nr:hypothetical protein D5S17_31010 [Pseudonocardiaceae bacterium YIM PH 21723]